MLFFNAFMICRTWKQFHLLRNWLKFRRKSLEDVGCGGPFCACHKNREGFLRFLRGMRCEQGWNDEDESPRIWKDQ